MRPAHAAHVRRAQHSAAVRPNRRLHRRPCAYLCICLALLLCGAVLLSLFAQLQWQDRQSGKLYQALAAQIVAATPEAAADSALQAPSIVDFAQLAAQNPEAVAWLEMPGLGLSLPIVHTDNNDYYLHHNFMRETDKNGCLFLSADDSADWSDLYNIVYGHNMRSGKMFGALDRYSDSSFYAQNPVFFLYTPQRTYLCRIFSCHSTYDPGEVYTSGWTAGTAYDAFLEQLASLSDYDTGVAVPSGSQVLTLSTCQTAYGSRSRRFVLHAVLEPL